MAGYETVGQDGRCAVIYSVFQPGSVRLHRSCFRTAVLKQPTVETLYSNCFLCTPGADQSETPSRLRPFDKMDQGMECGKPTVVKSILCPAANLPS